MDMIEFNGIYSNESDNTLFNSLLNNSFNNSFAVLVQFDGVMLHIWHLADPFYRLLSSDSFHMSYARWDKKYRIKLPNGGHILTDDDAAIFLLKQQHRTKGRYLLQNSMLLHSIAALLLSLVVLAGTCMVLR